MTGSEPTADLHLYLQDAREALLWKLEGLSEYDLRRPMTPTGTNLLGLVKHVAGAEAAYLGETFGRPFDGPLLWIAGEAEPNSDMWATADETREQIVELYHPMFPELLRGLLNVVAIGTLAVWSRLHFKGSGSSRGSSAFAT
jgi:hypothetical protein